MSDRDRSTLPTICPDCGHRASLHENDGCRALLLGRGDGSRTCECEKTRPQVLAAHLPQRPAELDERADEREPRRV